MNKLTERLFARFKGALVLGLALLIAALPAAAHNVYASFTDVFWNDDDKSVELVIEAHAHEIEAYLSVELGKRLSFLDDKDIPELEKAVGPMILDDLELSLDGTPVKLKYLGMKLESQTLMLFLEADWPTRPKNVTIMNKMLIGNLPGQTNSVLVRVGADRKGGDIREGSSSLSFDF
ncbi:DUF6702 family protein [Gimibacter soli]|uniref:Uncharacterized protein n=1 Tax=Gimibacter soli TaxID=3024400 RepID=A0AAE9XR76_9PROT|nr:DUF6702 family protein [Gimibacter soli]WCL55722.1 hypothetical protein PH603_08130 [Gimibacter soli]